MKKPLKKILLRTVPLVFLFIYGFFAWYSSEITLSPQRRILQTYHHNILQKPREFGLSCTAERTSQDMPYLICEPVAHGYAQKSRELRAVLEKRNISLPSWGQMRANIIVLHSHKGRKEDLLPVCERFCAAGFRCLLPDLPGHGDNPMPSMHFGKQEVPLLRQMWQQHLQKYPQHQGPLFFFGYSQGGVISLLAAADTTSWQAAGVVSVNAFATLDCPILSSADHLPIVFRSISALPTSACAIGIRYRVGSWPHQIGPLPHASSITCPTMIVHGEKDRFVPLSQAQAIFDAIPHNQKKYLVVPGAGHQNTLSTGSTPLYADICAWFLAALAKPKS